MRRRGHASPRPALICQHAATARYRAVAVRPDATPHDVSLALPDRRPILESGPPIVRPGHLEDAPPARHQPAAAACFLPGTEIDTAVRWTKLTKCGGTDYWRGGRHRSAERHRSGDPGFAKTARAMGDQARPWSPRCASTRGAPQ